jgi:tRNA threonylcarbamoyladenosine biosynthesis protein TsaE
VVKTSSPAQTRRLGEEFAPKLKAGDLVGLFGELGSGKTTFVKGVVKGLGVTEVVRSPSFILVSPYLGKLPIYHIDLYRISDPKELSALNLEEYFYSEGICLVEWADRAGPYLPKFLIRVEFEIKGKRERSIRITL